MAAEDRWTFGSVSHGQDGDRLRPEDESKQEEWWTEVLSRLQPPLVDVGLYEVHNPRKGSISGTQLPGRRGSRLSDVGDATRIPGVPASESGKSHEEASHYFDQLEAQRTNVDAAFGSDLTWLDDDDMKANLLRWNSPVEVGYRHEPGEWGLAADSLVAATIRLIHSTQDLMAGLTPWVEDVDDEPEETSIVQVQQPV